MEDFNLDFDFSAIVEKAPELVNVEPPKEDPAPPVQENDNVRSMVEELIRRNKHDS